jgi:peptidoglycan/xylan/chitin deacetylase (PgdA/CDA1 family)
VKALAILFCLTAALATRAAMAAESGVVLLYHKFGEENSPGTNIPLATFDAHIKELTSGRYHVMPLDEMLSAIMEKRPLPDRAVAITIDDGHPSIYTRAWPRLKAAKLPFTVFVMTTPIDAHNRSAMTWDQLREMAKGGATIAAHSATHPHMVEMDDDQARAELALSNKRIAEEIGKAPTIFSYPYGEVSAHLMGLVKQAGYKFAVAEQSGAVGRTTDPFHVPRFPVSDPYAGIERLHQVANTLPIPVTDVTPGDLTVTTPNPPNWGFTVAADVGRLDGLACTASTEGRAKVERLGERRIEVRLKKPFPKGRSRINCTMPGPDGRWRWMGTEFYVPK